MYIRSNVEILLGCVPVMLHVYWLLAAGAAVAAHLPITPDTFRQAPLCLLQEPPQGEKPRPTGVRALTASVCRQAVALSASRGKTWDSRPRHGLGLATVGH